MISITEKRLQELLYAERMLCALEAEGVDNWEGYEDIDWDYINTEPALSSIL